jgi:hypothetical protein
LIQWFLERVDPAQLAEAQRLRNNRRAAARLHLALIIAYDIIEIFQILLDELAAALDSHQNQTDGSHRFTLNLYRTTSLLRQQSDNLDRLDHLFRDLYSEMRLLDPSFEPTFREMFSGKFSVLLDAQHLLTSARLPIHEDHPAPPGDGHDLTYRTLWFSPESPPADREREARYLHGDDGREKEVVDVHVADGEPFFLELKRYFEIEKPYERLEALREAAAAYGQAVESRLSLSEVLSDLGSITSRANWASRPPGPEGLNRREGRSDLCRIPRQALPGSS